MDIVDDDAMILDSTEPNPIKGQYYVIKKYNKNKWIKEDGYIKINEMNAYGTNTKFKARFTPNDILSVETFMDKDW